LFGFDWFVAYLVLFSGWWFCLGWGFFFKKL
jgi:hypothetical protein